MGCYLDPDDATSIERITEAMSHRPCKAALLVVGDLNANITDPEGNGRDKEITAALLGAGLENMSRHFLSCRTSWAWYDRTWIMLRRGRVVWSRKDCILDTDRRMFQNICICETRHNTDHYMILGYICVTAQGYYQRYLGWRTQLPLLPSRVPKRYDLLVAELRGFIPEPRWT